MGLDFELDLLLRRESLSFDQAHEAMGRILSGSEPPAQIAGFLVALRMKSETAEEIAGFAAAMRDSVIRIDAPATGPIVDTCGTGGDGAGTFNISTVVAFVAAGAGAVVAKHGNRSISSRSGSADVLEALGVNIDLKPRQMALCLAQVGIGFLFAPALHPTMKHVQPIRRELGLRTVFNYLGPLANPAATPFQVIGAPSKEVARRMSRALKRLGTERSFIVHGEDGLDEISITAPTTVYEVSEKHVVQFNVTPGDLGLPLATIEQLAGGDARMNASIAHAILRGEEGPRRDIVLANAAAVLMAAGLARDWRHGIALAAESIDRGRALEKLQALVGLTRSFGEEQ